MIVRASKYYNGKEMELLFNGGYGGSTAEESAIYRQLARDLIAVGFTVQGVEFDEPEPTIEKLAAEDRLIKI